MSFVVHGTGNRAAAGYMLASVIGFSVVPLLIAAGGQEAPFLFSAGLRLGAIAGYLVLLTVVYPTLFFSTKTWVLVARRMMKSPLQIGNRITNTPLPIVLATVTYFDYMFFALAIQNRNIDPSIAAVFYETWPILLIVLTGLLFRKDQRYSTTSYYVYALSALGFIGFGFVVFSQTGNVVLNDLVLIDIIFLFLALTLAPLAAFGLRWGVDLAKGLKSDRHEPEEINFFGVILANLIGNVITVPAVLLAAGLRSEAMTYTTFLYTIIGGFTCLSIANILWRKVNLTTTELGINALSYTTPLFSLLWLFLFAQVNVARIDYLVIGTAAIITANLLINFKAEVRFGFRALILALWSCGAFVYLRDDFMHLLPFHDWLWHRETYLGSVGLSATVFILLLTFRVARLAPRTQDEDNRIFALHQAVELLASRNLIAPETSKHILDVDGARNPEKLRIAYTQAKLCFARAAAVYHPDADRKLLADAETQLNMVVHSRQQGVDFGELFSLIIFGGATVLLSLVSRPEVSGWTAFIYEIFSVLFPAVIVFLIVNVWDLHRDRADLVLAAQSGDESYGVIFRDPRSRRFERTVSTIIGLGIAATYAGLLWYKWLD